MTAVALRRAPSPEPEQDRFARELDAFPAPALELLVQRELLRRVDAKFVVRCEALPELVAGLGDRYAAFKVASGSIADYRSLYFDTAELSAYHDHRCGRRLRHKVRIRHYPDRSMSYLEIKAKRSDLVTHKHRIEIPYGTEELAPEHLDFLRMHLGPIADRQQPELRVNYRRVGLLSLGSDERVTIDLDLAFVQLDGKRHELGPAAIVEVKQGARTRSSPILHRLREVGVREQSLSKYTTGIALTRDVRRNRLLVDLKAVERIVR